MSALYQYTQLDAFEKALLGRCGTECRRGLEDNFDRYPLENHLSWLLNYKVNDMGSQLLLHPDLFGNHLLPEPEVLPTPGSCCSRATGTWVSRRRAAPAP